MIPMFISF